MPSVHIANKSHNTRQQRSSLSLFTLLFLLAPFYSKPNIGGTGLSLTYNIPIWIAACWTIALAFFVAIKSKKMAYPKKWLFLLFFPVSVIGSTLLGKIDLPIDWLFRQLFVLGGTLFLFSLFQLKINRSILEKILFLIVLATGLHGLLGLFQVIAPELLINGFPYNPDNVPRGMFQQINVNASFLVTGAIIILFLISQPNFKRAGLLKRFIVSASFALAIYVIIASGSRIGLLSLVVTIPLLFWSRFSQLKNQKGLLVTLFILGCISIYSGQAGLERTIDKTTLLAEDTFKASRPNMYAIGLELVSQKPVQGHGIGGFLKSWNLQASNYVSRHPEATLPEFTTHPHNELLFWAIEGGILALLGILVMSFGILIALLHCGIKRGASYGALLLPITLHTQVELPFYISSLHWFLWLFLIYLPLRHQVSTKHITLSAPATQLAKFASVSFAASVTIFMINTDHAQTDLFHYLYHKDQKPPYLQKALNNIYFRADAEKAAMRSMLHEAIQENNLKNIELFEKWAKRYVQKKPELEMYQHLITASKALRPSSSGCDAIESGIAMYAHNQTLQKAAFDCSLQKKQAS